MDEPIVYLIQEPLKHVPGLDKPVPKFSLEPALKYGRVVTLLNWGDTRSPLNMQFLHEKLADGLRDYTANDYILLAGNPVAIGLAAMIASDRTEGKVRMLTFNKKEDAYEVADCDMNTVDSHLGEFRHPL
jgi:hypothetical protein